MIKLLVILAVTLIAAVGVQAQTTTNAMPPFSEPGDIEKLLNDVGISSNPTNYAAAIFVGRSMSQNQTSAGLIVIENVNNYVGVAAGIDHLWGGGKIGSANIVSGGLSLKVATHPLSFLSSDTNSWFQTFQATPFDLALAGASIGNTSGSGGGLAAINRAGVNFDIYNLKGFELGLSLDYGTRAGSAAYNGNWLDGAINIRKGF